MTPTTRLVHIRWILGGVGIGLAVGISALGVHAARTADREEQLLHQAVADRVFDELERALTELVRVEEGRPFGHWRHLYVPSDQVIGTGLSASPLAPLPVEPHVVGYFQYDPDGTLRSPHLLDADEVAHDDLAVDQSEPRAERVAELARLTHDVTGFADRTPPPVPRRRRPVTRPAARPAPAPVVAPAPPPLQVWNQALNNASAPRQARVEQRVQAPEAQVRLFSPSTPVTQAPAPPVAAPPPRLPPERRLDVVVEPMSVSAGPEATLRFTRAVRIDARTWVQGVVFRRGPLRTWIEDRALGTGSLDHIEVSWDTPLQGPYAYQHQFADPFADWTVHVAVSPAPTEGPSPRQTVLALTGLAALGALLGLFAAYRTAAASVAWAVQRDTFVSAVTHELKTPLTAIQMYAEMLDQGLIDDPDRARRYHATIHAEATRLGRLIDDVLQFSALARPHAAPPSDQTVGDAVDRAVTLAEAHDVTVHAEVDEAVARRLVPGDLVVQVLTNLLDNAAKFAGGAPVEVSARPAEGWLELSVADRGPGVDPAFLPRMFEPFVRSESAKQQETRGTGLGLALVRSLVTHARGRVAAANRSGGGLVVTVTLPVGKPPLTEP